MSTLRTCEIYNNVYKLGCNLLQTYALTLLLPFPILFASQVRVISRSSRTSAKFEIPRRMEISCNGEECVEIRHIRGNAPEFVYQGSFNVVEKFIAHGVLRLLPFKTYHIKLPNVTINSLG